MRLAATTESRATGAGVLERSDRLLRLLQGHGELSARGLAELSGEPRTTVYRLLAQLREIGLVEDGPRHGTYRLGIRILAMADAVHARLNLHEAAVPVLATLRARSEETVFLCERRGDRVVCIQRIDGALVGVLALRLGGALPLHAGAAARAVLAHLDEREWEGYAQRGELEAYTSHTLVTAEALRADAARIRRVGYAESDGDVTEGVAALGAPVFSASGMVLGAISVSGVRPAILGDARCALVGAVVESARAISASLGHAPG